MTARPPTKPRRSGDLAIFTAVAVFDLRLSNADIRVLAALSTYAGKDGKCWPATTTLAQGTNMSKRYVLTCLQDLRKFGYVTIKKRPGTSSLYHIPMNHSSPHPGTIVHQPVNHSSPDPGTIVHPNDIKNDTKNDYAFLGKVIRLDAEGFNCWAEAYSLLDLRAELQALDDWYDRNLTVTERKKWYQRCSAALAKKNRTARLESNTDYGGDSDVIH